jgi:hypothetical protein
MGTRGHVAPGAYVDGTPRRLATPTAVVSAAMGAIGVLTDRADPAPRTARPGLRPLVKMWPGPDGPRRHVSAGLGNDPRGACERSQSVGAGWRACHNAVAPLWHRHDESVSAWKDSRSARASTLGRPVKCQIRDGPGLRGWAFGRQP